MVRKKKIIRNKTQNNKNMKYPNYRIRKTTSYNNIGNIERISYYVQKRKSILGIKYWKTITHETLGLNGMVSVPTSFGNYDDAYKFCDRLKKGSRINSTKDEVVSYA
jgi:hypothetical protein